MPRVGLRIILRADRSVHTHRTFAPVCTLRISQLRFTHAHPHHLHARTRVIATRTTHAPLRTRLSCRTFARTRQFGTSVLRAPFTHTHRTRRSVCRSFVRAILHLPRTRTHRVLPRRALQFYLFNADLHAHIVLRLPHVALRAFAPRARTRDRIHAHADHRFCAHGQIVADQHVEHAFGSLRLRGFCAARRFWFAIVYMHYTLPHSVCVAGLVYAFTFCHRAFTAHTRTARARGSRSDQRTTPHAILYAHTHAHTAIG